MSRMCGGSLPDDASPEEGEDHVEKQGAPDDKVIDPGPVVRVQGELQQTHRVRSQHHYNPRRRRRALTQPAAAALMQ